jgi:hypothetical protein
VHLELRVVPLVHEEVAVGHVPLPAHLAQHVLELEVEVVAPVLRRGGGGGGVACRASGSSSSGSVRYGRGWVVLVWLLVLVADDVAVAPPLINIVQNLRLCLSIDRYKRRIE